jgi:hypothetical protein
MPTAAAIRPTPPDPTAPVPPFAEPPGVPHRTRRGLRRALGVLAGAGGIVMVLFGAFSLVELLAADTTESRASYAGVRSIELDDGSGGVAVTSGPAGSRVQVVTRVRRSLRTPHTSAAVRDGVLHLRSSCPWFGSVSCSYRIRIPDGLPVRIVSHAGDVDVTGVQADSVFLRSSAGDVHADGVRTRRMTASTSAGDVSVDLLSAPSELVATSSAGDVDVRLPDAVYDLQADTSAGDRHVDGIREDPASPRHVTARTGAGDVSVELGR